MGLASTDESSDTLFGLLAVTRIAFGTALCVVGYRFYRFAMPIAALYVCGDYVAMLVSVLEYGIVQTMRGYWASFFIGGLICAGIAFAHLQSGVAISGFSAGVLLAIMFMEMVSLSAKYELRIVLMAIAGVICGGVTFKLQRPALLVALAFVGASELIWGVRYFIAKHMTEKALEEYLNKLLAAPTPKYTSKYSSKYTTAPRYTPTPTPSGSSFTESLESDIKTMWWITFFVSLVIFAVSVLLQFKVTAKDTHHEAPVGEQLDAIPLDHDAEFPNVTVSYAVSRTPERSANIV